jgi:hypothetical protein
MLTGFDLGRFDKDQKPRAAATEHVARLNAFQRMRLAAPAYGRYWHQFAALQQFAAAYWGSTGATYEGVSSCPPPQLTKGDSSRRTLPAAAASSKLCMPMHR